MSDPSDKYEFNPAVPYSQEAEASVIGCVASNPRSYYQVAQVLDDRDFFLLRHQWMWAAIKYLMVRDGTFDYLTLAEELKKAGHEKETGGIGYILQLINQTPTSVHVDIYAKIVQRASYRRRLLQTSENLKALAIDETVDTDTVRDKASQYFLNTIEASAERRITPADRAAMAYLEMFDRLLVNPKAMLGIPSGFDDVDAFTQGARNGQMVVIAGRPGMGKTSYMICKAINMARWGASVVMWSGEMSQEEYTHRFISVLSDVPLAVVKNPSLASKAQIEQIFAGGDAFYKMSIVIDDTPAISIPGLYLTALEYKARGKCDLMMIDHLGLMSYPDLDRKSDETLRIGRLSTGLKTMARQLMIPIVVASQLSRDVEKRQDKRPQLSDLRQSGNIEQDADVVQFLYRDEVYNPATETPDMCDVIIAKNRDGATGTASLYFEKSRTAFKNAEKREINLRRDNGHTPTAPNATHASKSEPI